MCNNTCEEQQWLSIQSSEWEHPTKNDRPTETTTQGHNLKANPASTRFLDHLVHLISSSKARLKIVNPICKTSRYNRHHPRATSENIRLHQKLWGNARKRCQQHLGEHPLSSEASVFHEASWQRHI